MNVMTALIRREFLEHRGAFFYAPAVLVATLSVLFLIGLIFGHVSGTTVVEHDLDALDMLQIAFTSISIAWTAYLVIALYFYYADAFSSDSRNNSMLFWKSMPVSDIKILTAKALSGVTILPALILGFALLTMVVAYVFSFPLSMRLPLVQTVNPIDMLATLFSMGIATAVFSILTILWYAPFLALVAGMSVLVKRWAIPAAILFIVALIVTEGILTFGNFGNELPISAYIAYRASGLGEEYHLLQIITHGGYLAPFEMIAVFVSKIDWMQMGIGVLFAAAVVYVSSEYRRRRLDI